jgi:hypothetical protein
MARREVLSTVLDFLGPLGPFESADERTSREESWARAAGPSTVNDLLDLVIHPPQPSELERAAPAEFEYALSRFLSLIGARNTADFLGRIGPLIGVPAARPTLIEVIGALGAQEGFAWIAPLVEASELSEEEEIRLAGAIAEIGGPQARTLLEQLRARTPSAHRRAMEEIDIASQFLHARNH